MSLTDFQGSGVGLPGGGDAGPVNKPPLPAPKSVSLEAFTGKTTETAPNPFHPAPVSPPAEGEHFLKRAGKDIAGVADMVLSVPGGLASTLAGKGYETFAPLPTSKQQAKEQEETAAKVRGNVAAWTTSPIAHLMHALGYKDDYSDADVGKVSSMVQGWMQKGGDWISKKSGGAVSSQQVQMLAADLQNLAPLGFSRFALLERAKLSPEELRSGVIGDKTAEGILHRYTEDTGNPEGLNAKDIGRRMAETLTTKSDAEIAAEAKAYDLMKRGASLKETLAARKANPLVGKKLDEFMAKRQDIIKGPMAAPRADVTEVLGPERPIPTSSGPQLENGPTAAPRPGMGGNEPPGAPTAPRPELPPPRAQLTNQHPGDFRPPRGQRGGAAIATITPIATAAVGAYVGAHAAEQDHIEGAILGGFGGLAAGLLPGMASKLSDKWKSGLKLGATTVGVSAGLAALDKDHPVEGALIGALWGGSHFLPKAKVPMVGNMSMDDLVNLRNGAIAAQEREIHNTAWAMRTAVPEPARREAVAAAVEKGSPAGLSPQEQQVYRAYKGFTKSYGEAAKDAGVLKDLVHNYVTHVVEREALPLTKVQEVMDALFGGAGAASGGASPASKFAKGRKYATFQELEQALQGSGLSIKTKDIADLVEIYGKSMSRAVENKRMFDNLKAATDGGPGGRPFILPADKAPSSFETINNPQLQGMRVHPDIAPALRFVAEQYKPGYITRGILGVSLAQKRLATGLSLFHAQNLINAYIGAGGNPLTLKGKVDAALKAYREGGLGDTIDTGLRNGLRIERPMETDLQAGQRLGKALDSLTSTVFGDKWHAFEKGIGGVEKIQRETFDKLTWDYLHSGLKLALFTREFEKGLRQHPDWSKDQVAKQVSSFVNDTFGGLDWFRVASETQTQLGRNIAMSAFSPKGRGAAQILMFAPDWTLSTFRAMYKALPGSGAMPLTQRLHQKYVLRTALIWATLMNGYNIAASGHPIWANQDPTKIEWKDGTTQQIAKHAMEGPEWLLNPRQTALNKVGVLPKEVVEQLTGQEYLTTSGRGMPMKNRWAHAAGSMTPLSFQTGSVPGRTPEEAAKRAALSSLGMPVYRMSKAEKEAAKRQREREGRKAKRYGSSR